MLFFFCSFDNKTPFNPVIISSFVANDDDTYNTHDNIINNHSNKTKQNEDDNTITNEWGNKILTILHTYYNSLIESIKRHKFYDFRAFISVYSLIITLWIFILEYILRYVFTNELHQMFLETDSTQDKNNNPTLNIKINPVIRKTLTLLYIMFFCFGILNMKFNNSMFLVLPAIVLCFISVCYLYKFFKEFNQILKKQRTSIGIIQSCVQLLCDNEKLEFIDIIPAIFNKLFLGRYEKIYIDVLLFSLVFFACSVLLITQKYITLITLVSISLVVNLILGKISMQFLLISSFILVLSYIPLSFVVWVIIFILILLLIVVIQIIQRYHKELGEIIRSVKIILGKLANPTN
jgi:hypothetical protein